MPKVPRSVAKRYPPARIAMLAWIVLTRLWDDLTPEDRRRLADVIRQARRTRTVAPDDRRAVLEIVRKVDVRRIARDAALTQVPGGRMLGGRGRRSGGH
jgi:hypothetical protein